VQDRR